MENFSYEQASTLRYSVFRMHRRLRNETDSHSPLSFAEETVLAQLQAAPRQTGAELARFQRMTPQSMNKIVASLLRLYRLGQKPARQAPQGALPDRAGECHHRHHHQPPRPLDRRTSRRNTHRGRGRAARCGTAAAAPPRRQGNQSRTPSCPTRRSGGGRPPLRY